VIIMSKKSIVQTIINRNVERQLVREFLIKNTKKSGFGGLEIRRTPAGTDVTVHAERPGMVIGRKGKIINDLQSRLSQEFELYNPKLKVEEVKKPVLNAQVMAEKIAASLERGWYHRRACHSAAQNIMDAGARGVIVTVAGKLSGETALQHMDKGYSVAVKKLGTIGVTLQIMRPGTKLPHEITIFSDEELKVQAAQEEIEGADAQ
jgi:small subunit ribosomal protein S3